MAPLVLYFVVMFPVVPKVINISNSGTYQNWTILVCTRIEVAKYNMIVHIWAYPFQCRDYFRPKHKDAKIFEKHLNPVMLVLIG